MKKILTLFLALMLLTACSFRKNNLDDATIYTTVYPVSFIMNYLYSDDSTISSIYPEDANINDYNLTEKQVSDYSKGDLFVYMGIGHEKEIAKSLINANNNLLIIDATYGLSYDNNIEELWLAPNNFLMLAKNIKNTLIDYLDNTIKEENVVMKYDELYTKVSWIDAELRNIAKESREKGNNTLVVSSNTFKYLEHYGFNVISLEEIVASGSESALTDLKSKFKSSKYNGIIMLKSEDTNDLISELTKNYNAKIITINDMITSVETASDYVSVQNENIASIRNFLLD